MKATLKLILSMLIPLAEASGLQLENDGKPTDILIGEGLVYIGHFAQYLLDKSKGQNVTPPTIPTSLK